MKKRVKRLLPLFLCLCMLIGGTAYAQDENGENPGAEAVEKVEVSAAEELEASAYASGASADENQLAALAADNVAINEANFPDSAFRDYVSKNFDTDGDGSLSASERGAVARIDVPHRRISDLAGIQYFTESRELDCSGNQLTSLDVSNNTALTKLTCSNNQLTSLDVSKNTALTGLICYANQLTSLDVSKNTALTSLDCSSNRLTSLDVSKNTALTSLNCPGNQLTSLNVSDNSALTVLWCSDNQLTSLDVSKSISLTSLICYENQLTSLDVSKSTALTYLECWGNQLTSLNVSGNSALTDLECSGNQLASLDVSNNSALTTLSCSENRLASLDVSKSTALTYLECGGNQLTSLDVSNLVSLGSLSCAPVLKENIKCNSDRLRYFEYGGEPVYVRAYLQEGTWRVDLSVIAPPEEWDNILVGELGLPVDSEAGIWDMGTEASEWETCYIDLNGDGSEVKVLPVHVDYGEPGETVKAETNGTNVKADTSKVDTAAVYKAFGIGPGDTNVEIKVEQKEADGASRERMAEILKQSGDTALGVYEVVMSLYANGASKGTVTDGFGSLTLSLYAGKDHAGKKAVVYQLHGSDEVLTYKDLTIDSEGMVTISVSKLSSFAVALQNGSGTGTGQPGTGNSGTGNSSGTANGQTGIENGSGTDNKQPAAGNGSGTAGKTSTASVQKTSPKTGDPGHMVLWIMVIFFFGAITAFAISRKRQR